MSWFADCRPNHSNVERTSAMTYLYRIIYKTVNKINGRYYIGQHRTNSLNDRYLGSGKALELAIKKYGRDNFERHTLCLVNSEEEMNIKEAEYVTEEVVKDPKSYNLLLGGQQGSVRFKPGKEHLYFGKTRPNHSKIMRTKKRKDFSDNMKEKWKTGWNLSKKRRKSYKIKFLDGHEEIITHLSEFCRERNYTRQCIRKMNSGKLQKYKDITFVQFLT